MESIYLYKGSEFHVFIEKRAGTFFQIRGRDGVAFAPGEYLDAHVAKTEISKLRKKGFKERVGASES